MTDLKAYILFPGAARNPLYAGWMDRLTLPVEIVRDYDIDWLPPADAGIVITHNHYRWEELSILRQIVEKTAVPLLILVDGILEYRNAFQHPDLAEGCMLQPVIGHKVACIGRSQVRWIESWGNVGKCELVGMPRLDDVVGRERETDRSTEPFRLLVASARTPWFNDEQRETTFRGITAINEFVNANATIGGRPLEVCWRMAESLHLNLKVDGFQARPDPIRQVLEKVDAVVTTPSTLQLEAAALRLPVAVVDFHNSPQMTPMAWTIKHAAQVADSISELADPPAAKMLAQDVLLQDALQLQEPALERMSRLVDAMVKEGQLARKAGCRLTLPNRILSDPADGFCSEQASGQRARLFPGNQVFANQDVQRLQTELAAAVHEMGGYPGKYFQQRSANQRLRSYINWLRLLVRNRAATVEELTATVQNLRDQLADRPVKRD